MAKKMIIAIVAVFIAWQILDYVIHVVILAGSYQATQELWRPAGEMKMGLMYVVGLLATIAFVAVYAYLINPKSMGIAIKYGLIFGFGTGVGFGYGMYAVMPVPYHMALTWFLGTLVEAGIGGLLLGLIIKE